MYRLSADSYKKLAGVDKALVAVVTRAIEISSIDFLVSEGLRTRARQQELFDQRKSQTLNSKHLIGRAVDLAPIIKGVIPWDDKNKFEEVAIAMKRAAQELGIAIRWGGDFKTFYDGPHFELV